MSRKRKLVIGLLVLGGLTAVALLQALRADRGVEVRSESVVERDLVSTITATGQVRARRQVNISSDVMGRVVRLTVAEGDEVEQGQVLLSIDPRQVEAAVARARATLSQAESQVAQQRANLLQAERELARMRELRAGGVVTAQDVEESETRVEVQQALLSSSTHGVEQARAAMDEAEDQLSRTTIRAPISGRVIRLNIEEGETAVVGTMNNPGSLLLTIGDLSVIEAVLVVDETDVPLISVGDSARVELDAFPGRGFAARVSTIANSAIQTGSGTAPAQASGNVRFEVILTLLDPPPDLRPDLSATADIIVDRRERALSVPIISVTVRDADPARDASEGASLVTPAAASKTPGDDPGAEPSSSREGVFVIRDGRAIWTPVTLGITGQEHFEILSGLSRGDVVVSGPYQTIRDLRDRDPIRVSGEAARRR